MGHMIRTFYIDFCKHTHTHYTTHTLHYTTLHTLHYTHTHTHTTYDKTYCTVWWQFSLLAVDFNPQPG